MQRKRKNRKKKTTKPVMVRSVKTAGEIAAEEKKKKKEGIQFIALMFPLFWLAWSFGLTENTFVSAWVIFFMLAGSALVSMLVIYFIKQRLKMRFWAWSLLRHASIGIAIIYSTFAHINYYGPHTDVKTVSLSIVERGTKKVSRRGYGCGIIPYGAVIYNDIKREIRFKCADMETFPKARMIILRIEQGALGYAIYTDQCIDL